MDLDLAGKNIIVIGGSSNIGRAISLAFVKEGANVAIAARHIEDCQKVAEEAHTLNSGHAIAFEVDATKYESVESLVKMTIEVLKKIDVLVISMGWNTPGLFTDIDRKYWGKIIATNFQNVLNCFAIVLPKMMEQKSGNIISLASVVGRHGDPHEAVYGGLKAGVMNFSNAVAKQAAAYDVRINCVAPGLTVPTKKENLGGDSVWKSAVSPKQIDELIKEAKKNIPLGKLGKPIDVANAVLFLASNTAAGHITGTTIVVDGGLGC
jgi:2-hydroxycyclohexanecarboxyl-CoA dehydrogenase